MKKVIENCYKTLPLEAFRIAIEKMKRKADHHAFPGYTSLEIQDLADEVTGNKQAAIRDSDQILSLKLSAYNQEINNALDFLDETDEEEELAQEEILSKLEILPLDEDIIFRGKSRVLFEDLKMTYGGMNGK